MEHDSYRYWRKRGLTAVKAIENARKDAAENVKRYPASGNAWNPPFKAYGESHMRWIENPSACGLRFVGFAHEIIRLDHTGYYLDDYCGETVQAVVYQLPARYGQACYVYGYADPYNGKKGHEFTNPACLSFDIEAGQFGGCDGRASNDDGARDAARFADSIAESFADKTREYAQVDSARQQYDSQGEDIASNRREALALIREIKGLCPCLADFPAIRVTLRERLESLLDDIRNLRESRDTLESDFGRHDGWKNA